MVPNKLLKYGGKELISELVSFIQKVSNNQEIPNEMKISVTISIYKKGNKKRPENYRTITLLSSVLKLITEITLNKLKTGK